MTGARIIVLATPMFLVLIAAEPCLYGARGPLRGSNPMWANLQVLRRPGPGRPARAPLGQQVAGVVRAAQLTPG